MPLGTSLGSGNAKAPPDSELTTRGREVVAGKHTFVFMPNKTGKTSQQAGVVAVAADHRNTTGTSGTDGG